MSETTPEKRANATQNPSAGDLVHRAERFATLLGPVQRKLFLYILSLAGNPADAEDILQETNLVLWRKFEEFRDGSDFTAWAIKVAFFEVLKHRERYSRQGHLFTEATLELLSSDAAQVVQEADHRREALIYCLSKLRPAIRKMIELRYQVQADIREVAEAMGRSIEATRRALHRARVELLKCIQKRLEQLQK